MPRCAPALPLPLAPVPISTRAYCAPRRLPQGKDMKHNPTNLQRRANDLRAYFAELLGESPPRPLAPRDQWALCWPLAGVLAPAARPAGLPVVGGAVTDAGLVPWRHGLPPRAGRRPSMRPPAMLAAVGGLTTKQIVTAESTHWQAGSAEEDEACATPEPQATSTPEWPARAADHFCDVSHSGRHQSKCCEFPILLLRHH